MIVQIICISTCGECLRLQLEEDIEEILRTFSMLTTVYLNFSPHKKRRISWGTFCVQVTAVVSSNKKITLWIFNLSFLPLELFFFLMNSSFALSTLKFVILMNNLVRKHNLHLLDLMEFTTRFSLYVVNCVMHLCVGSEKKLNKLK